MARPINPGPPLKANTAIAKSSANVPHVLPAMMRVNRRAGAPAGPPAAAPPPAPSPVDVPMAPPPADAAPAMAHVATMAPAPAPLPPLPSPMFEDTVAAGDAPLSEPPPVPMADGAIPPPMPAVDTTAAEAAAHELHKDADQAADAEHKLDSLKGKMLGEVGGAVHEGPRVQAAIQGFVASERANLHNLETELENAALS